MQDPNKLLKQAVSEITHSINVDKLSPHEAVVKVAKTLDLNTHMIKRASEAINVALTYNHFKKHAEARDAEFPIVDAEKVAQEVYTPELKTIHEKKSEWFSVSVDDIPDFNKLLANPKIKKAYSEIVSTGEDYDSFGLSEKGICEKSAQYMDKLAQQVEDLQSKTAGLKFDVNRSFMTVVNRFSRDEAYRSSFPEFEKQSYALYGDRALPYLELIYKAGEIKEARGEHDAKYTAFKPSTETVLFGKLLDNVSEFNKTSELLSEASSTFKGANDMLKKAYHALGKSMFETPTTLINTVEAEKKAEEKVEEETDPVRVEALKKQASLSDFVKDEQVYLTENQRALPTRIKEAIVQSKKAEAEEETTRMKYAFSLIDTALDKYKKESTPGLTIPTTSHQDNLDRSLLLRELMVTDPILHSSDPKRVVDSYEQFLRLAPELSKEKDVVKGMLRQMVQTQALAPHEAQQLIEANTNFVKQKGREQGVELK